MDISFSVFYTSLPLAKPYYLSFGPISAFNTFYIIAKSLDDKDLFGIGEVTPLPGYNHETVSSVSNSLRTIFNRIQSGESVGTVLPSFLSSDPFAVSGLNVSIELLYKYSGMTKVGLAAPVPLTALCDAATPELIGRRAAELCSQGFSTLKLKVGQREVVDELERIRNVASNISPQIPLRLDANQSYSVTQAAQLCQGLEDIDCVALLEQPFKPAQWAETGNLIQKTRIPIMLDESIWSVADVDRAADIGVRHVKFKLCKHFGIQGSFDLIKRARFYDMGIVYGNGVQTAVGNHYEAIIHSQAGIQTGSEGNGFLKLKDSALRGTMTAHGGRLFDSGLDERILEIDQWKCVIPEVILSLDEEDFRCLEH
jgi:L-alanine-DL-glutamate epimerase-like enolase superfamily enzyme